jgi:hypothetical protein
MTIRNFEIGDQIIASGYLGRVVGTDTDARGFGYIPEGMVAVKMPGGYALKSTEELARPA